MQQLLAVKGDESEAVDLETLVFESKDVPFPSRVEVGIVVAVAEVDIAAVAVELGHQVENAATGIDFGNQQPRAAVGRGDLVEVV